MLFEDIIIKKNDELKPEFDLLFDEVLKNQSHKGDLLLVQVNGFYHPEAKSWTNIDNKSLYMVGHGMDGLSDMFHYRFIDSYRSSSISKLSYPEYLKLLEPSEEKIPEIDKLEQRESMTIQLEMLIYLKIWEADMFIKRLYQITNLSLGIPYDWHFKISESNRDNGVTGKREQIIRKKVRDRLQGKFPKIYTALKNAYKTQVRNAIAHSRYFCSGRYILLLNHIEDDPASQMKPVSFDEWIEMFNNTMAIYNQMIRFSNKINSYYLNLLSSPSDYIEVQLDQKYPMEATKILRLKYRQEFRDWLPEQSD